jgi:hypothetical protein
VVFVIRSSVFLNGAFGGGDRDEDEDRGALCVLV